MKKTICLISMLIIGYYAFSQQYKLIVKVEGLKSTTGNLVVGVYQSSPDFLKKEFTSATIPVESRNQQFTLSGMPGGSYAIAIYHDENEDGKLTANFMGLPKEGYAFSNNARGLVGPPDFNKAAIKLYGDRKITIIMKY